MRNLLFILLAFIAISCSNADFTKVKSGMSTSEVEKLVGQPKEKLNNILVNLWLYEDHVIFFDADGNVSEVFTNEEYTKAFEESFEDFDMDEFESDLNEAIEELSN